MAANRTIDLRSDTVTQPTDEMRDAMRDAVVGDDVFGEDPTVNRLEAMSAERVVKEAGVFMPTGTMVNQAAVFVHSHRWGEIIAEEGAHIIQNESGAPAILSNVMVRLLKGVRGVFTADQVRAAIRPDNVHNPRTRLVAIENTHNRAGGTVWTPTQTEAVARAAHDHGIPLHLDGARIFNSAIAQEVPVTQLTRDADSVAFCFSKGLSAPVGSVLCGPKDFIQESRRARKIFGGGMRQAGILAAAGIVALETMVDRLREDHSNARMIGAALAKIPGIQIDLASVQTNILIFDVGGLRIKAAEFCARLAEEGIKCSPRDVDTVVRMVTHRHVTREDAKFVGDTCRRLFETAAVKTVRAS